jgi:hypothetical protein
MTQCFEQLHLGILHGKRLSGGFDGGDISSDGGLMLLAAADARLGLTRELAACLRDDRQVAKVRHQLHELLAQRVYQIAAGYEDCNDADDLRHDPVLKTVVGRLPQTGPDLASQPTLSRFENRVTRRELWAMAQVLVEHFVARHADRRPKYLVLDFDATDDPTHGQQQFAEFHGFYDTHCYLPLLVTAQVDGGPQELLVAWLRRGRCHASRGALGVLKRLVARLRQQWPGVLILVRGDSGFAIPALYEWCEAQDTPVRYLIGLAQNSRLRALAEPHLQAARARFERTAVKVRRLHNASYAAESWPHERRVLIKAEVAAKGDNPRFVVTNLRGAALGLYNLYAARGEMENRIKELKCDLQMDRTSCHRFAANQFRVLLHAAAFVLHCALRAALAGTQLAQAQVCTLQRRLLKLGVRVKETARRVWLQFASSCPLQDLWPVLLARLKPLPT